MRPGPFTATAGDLRPTRAGAIPVLRALSDPTRLGLLRCLMDGERCVGDLTRILGLRQPRISHHLAILRRLELVTHRRAGKKIFYRLHARWHGDASLDLGGIRLELRR